MATQIAGLFQLEHSIDSGAFGEVFSGTALGSNDRVAIKMELLTAKQHHLPREAKILKLLQGGAGIPIYYWSGVHDKHNVLVMERLGSSLESLFKLCKRKFSVRTVLLLADQMISLIHYVHKHNYLHRDIKPDNFLMGLKDKSHIVHIIDFGLSKVYRKLDMFHIPYVEGKTLTGTARYASINTHRGIEQARRDDLESLAYTLLYFNMGTLPWQGLKAATRRQKYEKIAELKQSTRIKDLCKNVPYEFGLFLHLCRSINFTQRPDYTYMRKIFKNLYKRSKYPEDIRFDWQELEVASSASDATTTNETLTGSDEELLVEVKATLKRNYNLDEGITESSIAFLG